MRAARAGACGQQQAAARGGPPPLDPAAAMAQLLQQAQQFQQQQQLQQALVGLQGNYNDLNQFPLDPNVDPLGRAFLTCGITTNHAQFALAVTEQLDSLEALEQLGLDDVDTLAAALARRTPGQQGGYKLTMNQSLNLKALVWWLKDKVTRGLPIADEQFTVNDLVQAKEELRAYEAKVKDTTTLSKPEKFPGIQKWVNWWESVKLFGICIWSPHEEHIVCCQTRCTTYQPNTRTDEDASGYIDWTYVPAGQ